MTLTIGIVAWAVIGAIAGLVAPMLAGTFAKDRATRMCAFGAALATASGLVAYVVDSLFGDAAPGAGFFSSSGVMLALVVTTVLYLNEKRRSDPA